MRKALFSIVLFAAAVAGTGGSAWAGDRYAVDASHSALMFSVQHFNAGNQWGRFNNPTGTIVWDSADPTKSTFNVTVNTANVDTDNQKRDDHLRSPDFFAAKQYPTMSFKSTSVKPVSDKAYEVTGELTIRGVTRPVTVPMQLVGAAVDPMGKPRVGFEGTFTIDRREFEMGIMPDKVGTSVRIIVAIEAIKE
jgi:polyisoprenoid-binding protein YceI